MPGDINSYALSLELSFTENASTQLDRIANTVGSIEKSLLAASNQFSNFAFKTLDGGKAFNKLSTNVSGFNKQTTSVSVLFRDIARTLINIQRTNLSSPIEKLLSKTLQYDKLRKSMMATDKVSGSEKYTAKKQQTVEKQVVSKPSRSTATSSSNDLAQSMTKLPFNKTGSSAKSASEHINKFEGVLKSANIATKALDYSLVGGSLVPALGATSSSGNVVSTSMGGVADMFGTVLEGAQRLEQQLFGGLGSKKVNEVINTQISGPLEGVTKFLAPLSAQAAEFGEKFHTLNYRAIGSMREMQQELFKIGEAWPFTMDEIQKGMTALRESGMDADHIMGNKAKGIDNLLHSVLAFERMTGADAAGIAQFETSMLAMGNSTNAVKAKLAQLTDAQRKYGLTGKDINSILSAQSAAALKFGGTSAQSVNEYTNSLVSAAAAAKQLGLSADQAMHVKDQHDSNIAQQILMSGGKWRLNQSDEERQSNEAAFMQSDKYKKSAIFRSKDFQRFGWGSKVFRSEQENQINAGLTAKKDAAGNTIGYQKADIIPGPKGGNADDAMGAQFDQDSSKGGKDLESSRGLTRKAAEWDSKVMANLYDSTDKVSQGFEGLFDTLLKFDNVAGLYADSLMLRVGGVAGGAALLSKIGDTGEAPSEKGIPTPSPIPKSPTIPPPKKTVPPVTFHKTPEPNVVASNDGDNDEISIMEREAARSIKGARSASEVHEATIKAASAKFAKHMTQMDPLLDFADNQKDDGREGMKDLHGYVSPTSYSSDTTELRATQVINASPGTERDYDDEKVAPIFTKLKRDEPIPPSPVPAPTVEDNLKNQQLRRRLDALRSTGQPISWNASNIDVFRFMKQNHLDEQIKAKKRVRTDAEKEASIKSLMQTGMPINDPELATFKRKKDLADPTSPISQRKKHDEDTYQTIKTLQQSGEPIRDRNLQMFMKSNSYKQMQGESPGVPQPKPIKMPKVASGRTIAMPEIHKPKIDGVEDDQANLDLGTLEGHGVQTNQHLGKMVKLMERKSNFAPSSVCQYNPTTPPFA